MKRTLIVALCLFMHSLFIAQNVSLLPVIPRPNSVVLQKVTFAFSGETRIVLGNPAMLSEASAFVTFIDRYYSYRMHVLPDMQPGMPSVVLKPVTWDKDSPEKYELTIAKDQITLAAQPNGSGFFYGFQTLLQMLLAKQDAYVGQNTPTIILQCMKIIDEPRYAWRGMHLDVSRHFFGVAFVKKYIDILAHYKLNTFHWHLTDDQGWRIEIKKYPNLIRTGAWRSGSMVGKYSDNKFDSLRHGGFYTQSDVREIVMYAQQRHITIVPEIEMPGHAVAAVAAYPYLSCTGKTLEVEKGWGVFDDVFCTKDTTFRFLEDVLAEVMDLFPSQYIHIGGDECPKVRWKACPQCQARMKSEGLKNEEELQSYFIRRIEKFVNAHGRQIIGWDEILEGGLAPNAAVMSWRGTKGGIEAAKHKHKVVMSPSNPCYFDYYQAQDKDSEPVAIGGYNPIDSVYAYNPTPPGLSREEQKYILGAQANLWTEYITTERQAEYMLMPRLMALSEVLWTTQANKDHADFKLRLQQNTKWLENMHVNYARHAFNIKK